MQKMYLILMTLGLLGLAACASTPTHQAPGEYFDDATITTKVKSALIANPVAEAHEIEVETFRGVVQLSGFVDTTNERDTAQKVAQRVAGVKSVHNNIEVRSDGHSCGYCIGRYRRHDPSEVRVGRQSSDEGAPDQRGDRERCRAAVGLRRFDE